MREILHRWPNIALSIQQTIFIRHCNIKHVLGLIDYFLSLIVFKYSFSFYVCFFFWCRRSKFDTMFGCSSRFHAKQHELYARMKFMILNFESLVGYILVCAHCVAVLWSAAKYMYIICDYLLTSSVTQLYIISSSYVLSLLLLLL